MIWKNALPTKISCFPSGCRSLAYQCHCCCCCCYRYCFLLKILINNDERIKEERKKNQITKTHQNIYYTHQYTEFRPSFWLLTTPLWRLLVPMSDLSSFELSSPVKSSLNTPLKLNLCWGGCHKVWLVHGWNSTHSPYIIITYKTVFFLSFSQKHTHTHRLSFFIIYFSFHQLIFFLTIAIRIIQKSH